MGAIVIFDVIANRPVAAPENTRYFFVATDEDPTTYVSDGTAWTAIGGGGPAAVSSVFGRTGDVVAVADDYTAAEVTDAADKSSASTQTFTGELAAPDVAVSGLTGATEASRYVGATTTGAPVTGSFAEGDFVIAKTDAAIWVCTVAGSPGTWTQTGAGGSLPSWFQSGSGSPVGAVAPAQINAIYVDVDASTPGGIYKALGATDADWISIGGEADTAIPGISTDHSGRVLLLSGLGSSVVLTDVAAWSGIGNGLEWDGNGADGAQQLFLRLGSTGQFTWTFGADGSLEISEGGNPFFRVGPDGNIHILTGATVIADL